MKKIMIAGLLLLIAAVGTAWAATPTVTRSDTLRITAPHTTGITGRTTPVSTLNMEAFTFCVDVTNANTSTTWRLLGKMKKMGTGWAKLDNTADSTVVTGNAVQLLTYVWPSLVDSICAEFVSEAGGTAATPLTQFKFQWYVP
jgi:hypothetical protein